MADFCDWFKVLTHFFGRKAATILAIYSISLASNIKCYQAKIEPAFFFLLSSNLNKRSLFDEIGSSSFIYFNHFGQYDFILCTQACCQHTIFVES